MKGKTVSHYHGFLVEFVLVILFFSIASAMVLRVFAAAHTVRQKANELTIALTKIQSFAEYTKTTSSINEYITILQNQGAVKSEEGLEQYILYYNKKWELQKGETGYAYSIEINLESQWLRSGELLQVAIRSMKINEGKMRQEHTKDVDEICALETGKYYPYPSY
jgi:cell division protein YceG involved in septum cleavage